jgi:effector-binding domain-containing protein
MEPSAVAPIVARTLSAMRFASLVDRGRPIDFRGAWTRFAPAVQAQQGDLAKRRRAAVFQTAKLGAAMDWYAPSMVLEEGDTVAAPLEEVHVPAGSFVTSVYEGPHEGLGAAWGVFAERLAAAGHRLDPSRACFEIYGGGEGTPKTELYVAIC